MRILELDNPTERVWELLAGYDAIRFSRELEAEHPWFCAAVVATIDEHVRAMANRWGFISERPAVLA